MGTMNLIYPDSISTSCFPFFCYFPCVLLLAVSFSYFVSSTTTGRSNGRLKFVNQELQHEKLSKQYQSMRQNYGKDRANTII